MTQNQINYQKYLEDVRSNRAREAQAQNELDETHRSNVARETWQQNTLNETIRSNQAREAEAHRANVAQENLGYQSNYLTSRRDTWAMLDNNEDRRITEEHYIRQDEQTKKRDQNTFLLGVATNDTNRYIADRNRELAETQMWVNLGGQLGGQALRSVISSGGKR